MTNVMRLLATVSRQGSRPRQSCGAEKRCHPDGLRFLQAGGPMQSRSARALEGELHGSSGAKKRRHQDDYVFPRRKMSSAARWHLETVTRQ